MSVTVRSLTTEMNESVSEAQMMDFPIVAKVIGCAE